MPNLEEALQQAKDKQGKPKFSRGNRPDRAVRSEPDNPNGSTFNRPLTPLAAVAIPAHFELAQNDPAENRRDAGSYAEKYSAKTNIAQEELAHNKPTKPEPVISSVETVIEPKTTFAKAPPLMEGYFKFSHGVFQNPILRDLSGDSFRIFLFLSSRAWQFPDSTGEVRASYSFIEMNTGVSVAQIKRSLSQMRDLGLIKIVSIDYKKGSTLWISPIACPPKSSPVIQRTEKYPPNGHSSAVDLAQKEPGASSFRTGSQLNLSQKLGQKELDLKKQEPKKSISLSKNEIPPNWRSFTEQLTEKARERADRVFQSLKNQFPADPISEIAEAPKNLERFGAPDGTPWGQISSPIGLMESSWPQLRDFFRKRTADTERASQSRQRIEVDQIKAQEQEAREAEESERRRARFFAAFPDEQGRRAAIQKYLVDFPFNADGMIGQNIAIGKWCDETQKILNGEAN